MIVKGLNEVAKQFIIILIMQIILLFIYNLFLLLLYIIFIIHIYCTDYLYIKNSYYTHYYTEFLCIIYIAIIHSYIGIFHHNNFIYII